MGSSPRSWLCACARGIVQLTHIGDTRGDSRCHVVVVVVVVVAVVVLLLLLLFFFIANSIEYDDLSTPPTRIRQRYVSDHGP
jgi:nitrogen fixation-related uncharacterized protein